MGDLETQIKKMQKERLVDERKMTDMQQEIQQMREEMQQMRREVYLVELDLTQFYSCMASGSPNPGGQSASASFIKLEKHPICGSLGKLCFEIPT